MNQEIVCPNCQRRQRIDRKTCWECGFKFEEQIDQESEKREITTPLQQIEHNKIKVKICPQCGRYNLASAWNCADESCGETLSIKTIVETTGPLPPDIERSLRDTQIPISTATQSSESEEPINPETSEGMASIHNEGSIDPRPVLSETEMLVLDLMSQGIRNLDIGLRLGISALLVVDIQNDLRKNYGVENNIELIRVARAGNSIISHAEPKPIPHVKEEFHESSSPSQVPEIENSRNQTRGKSKVLRIIAVIGVIGAVLLFAFSPITTWYTKRNAPIYFCAQTTNIEGEGQGDWSLYYIVPDGNSGFSKFPFNEFNSSEVVAIVAFPTGDKLLVATTDKLFIYDYDYRESGFSYFGSYESPSSSWTLVISDKGDRIAVLNLAPGALPSHMGYSSITIHHLDTNDTNESELYTGTELVNLLSVSNQFEFDFSSQVSPNGNWKLYDPEDGLGDEVTIGEYTAESSRLTVDVRPLTNELSNYDFIDWSPNSKLLLLSSIDDTSNLTTLYTVNVSGSELQQISGSTSKVAVDNIYPAWSPDGRNIVYVSYYVVGDVISRTLIVTDANGDNARYVIDSRYDVGCLDW